MRKALMGVLLGAAVMTPSVAPAQLTGDERVRQPQVLERYKRLEQRNRERYERRQEQLEDRREENRKRAQRRSERRQDQAVVQSRSAPPAGAWQGDPNDPRMERHRRRYERLEARNKWRYGTPEQREEVRQQWGDRFEERRDRRDDRRDWRDGSSDRRGWHRDWRRDRRYDWWSWRDRNRYLYRMPPYYSPYRHRGYSRFGIGIMLGRPYYNQRYWISDPWQYRLPPAPYGTQWVRYYDDVLLVDTWTGEVLDVIYDFFW